MRLRKLTMSNIGPYVGLTTLDFDALGDAFLVCGKTGSGKSTLFDAVSYALYGSAIAARDIVSHFAGPDDEAFVDLEFQAGTERWRVQRKPARTVAKKRGTGTTERPAEAALWTRRASGWEAYRDKIGEVDASVADIIGLSAGEFTKIVLLPQGEFQRFLEMNTNERTRILEKLFPVAAHAAVSDLAREKARDAELRAKDVDERLGAMEGRLGDDPEAALAALRDGLESAKAAAAAALSARDAAAAAAQAAALGSRAWAEYDAATAESAALESSAAEAASETARLSRAEAGLGAEPAVSAARLARTERDASAAALGSATAAVEAADARRPAVEASGARILELTASLESIVREEERAMARAEAWERAAVARSRLGAASAKLEESVAARRFAEDALSAALARLAELEGGAADPELLSTERAAASAIVESTREAERLAGEAEKYAAELDGLRARVAAAAEAVDTAEKDRLEAVGRLSEAESRVEALGDAIAAGRLAARLAPGVPCPVCGSMDHPAPVIAALAGSDDSSAAPAVADASDAGEKAVLSEARKSAGEAASKAAAAVARLDELRVALAERESLSSRYEGALPATRAAEEAQAARERLRVADEALAREVARGKDVSKVRVEADGLRRVLDEAKDGESKASAVASSAAAAVAEAESGAGDADPAPALEALRASRSAAFSERERLEVEVRAWEKERSAAVARSAEAAGRQERAAAALTEAEAAAVRALAEAGFVDEESWAAAAMVSSDLAAARARVRARAAAESSAAARLAAAGRAVSGVPRPDTAATEAAMVSASAAYADAQACAEESASAERDLAARIGDLAAARAERAELRKRGDRLLAMSRLLNGDTAGRRLSFKNFALASYFAQVVARASERLREMSDGRYDMSVSEGRAAGRVGLDLSVLDAFTGVARPASSLSGGEKFLASISLALGLSEVIVARAGGVALDSIFIDEGFGSLDDETLDRAMAALDRVRGERVIGIVSHVADLRSRVPARVEVVKTSLGSTLRVIA